MPAWPLFELEMNKATLVLSDGSLVALDAKGYMLDANAWRPEVAETMAMVDGIALTSEHWVILSIFRDYFVRFEIEPPMRALVSETRKRLGRDKVTSRFLYQLFPEGPTTQACRYAGLPRPVSCV
jgi:dissimilatory sulfite reductase related protein